MIKTIKINAKHDDRFFIRFISEDGKLVERDGYAPYIEGLGGGSYTKFEIDNETGKIIGWVPLTDEALEEILEDE